MIKYLLYKLGMRLAVSLPLNAAYKLATLIARFQYRVCFRDRRAVINNIKVILNTDDDKVVEPIARELFINFSKYLIDFFRFSIVDDDYIDKYVKIEGQEHLDEALKKGNGAIALTAHIGNWELAGVITASLGYPVSAVALSHKHKRVNELFVKQRERKGVKVIPLGVALRRCFTAFKNNEVVGLLGDRDFTEGGIDMEFLGKTVKMPKGPAIFSLKSGAVIVPTFLIRQPDDSFKLVYEKPFFCEHSGNIEEDVRLVEKNIIAVIENQIKLYPAQWFMFREFWSQDANKV